MSRVPETAIAAAVKLVPRSMPTPYMPDPFAELGGHHTIRGRYAAASGGYELSFGGSHGRCGGLRRRALPVMAGAAAVRRGARGGRLRGGRRPATGPARPYSSRCGDHGHPDAAWFGRRTADRRARAGALPRRRVVAVVPARRGTLPVPVAGDRHRADRVPAQGPGGRRSRAG